MTAYIFFCLEIYLQNYMKASLICQSIKKELTKKLLLEQ